MSVHINTLEIENVKRIKAVKIDCGGEPLTVVGGDNGQGKTSVLDAIAYALGGEKFRPGSLKREGALANPEIRVELSNGLIAERKGKNASLKVTDPQGRSGGQVLLNEFVTTFSLDLPRFLNASDKEKAATLLQVIGVGDELGVLEDKEEKLYQERLAIGRIADQKQKHADELTEYPDAPTVPVSAAELIQQQQAILARNGERQAKRRRVTQLTTDHGQLTTKVSELTAQLRSVERQLEQVTNDMQDAQKTAAELHDESTVEIEAKLNEIDSINVRVRANQDKAKASEEATEYKQKYEQVSEAIEQVRTQKMALLNSADLPLPGLAVEKGQLTFNGQPWDCMSSSDQLRAATAIVRKLNSECGFVLIDKLEQMDATSLAEFGEWLKQEGLQAIATRVSRGDECSIVIEDGFSVEKHGGEKNFTVGEF